MVIPDIGCSVPHDDPVHSTTVPPPTAQHSVVDGHDTPFSPVDPAMGCTIPHDDPVHSTAWPTPLLLLPTAQHSVVDGHDTLGYDSGGPNVDVTAVPLSVPFTPLGAGMVASLTTMPDDGVAVPENAPQDSPGIISAATSSIPIKNMPTRLAG